MKNILFTSIVIACCLTTACNHQEPQEINLDTLGSTSRTNKSVDLGTAWNYFEKYNTLESTNEELTYFQEQQADDDHLLITITFDEHILIENPKTFAQQRNHNMLEDGAIWGCKFHVNGKPFTGTLVGQLKGTNKKILVVAFKKGKLEERPKIWSDLGRLHKKLTPTKSTYSDDNENVVEEIDLETTRKPIIYLYPKQATQINVQLDYNGELTTTYPKYNKQKGWTVKAEPDGTLVDMSTQKEYYGLYWEGIDEQPYDLSTGFVVKGEETASFLDEKLAELGLTRREANEFIVYWLPELEQNEYNLIHFAQEAYQDLAKLQIKPQPATLIRVFMVYQPLKSKITLPQQELPKIVRKGFTVVEWGGTRMSNIIK